LEKIWPAFIGSARANPVVSKFTPQGDKIAALKACGDPAPADKRAHLQRPAIAKIARLPPWRHEEAMTSLERDEVKWLPVFRSSRGKTRTLERDDDSNKNHPALMGRYFRVLV